MTVSSMPGLARCCCFGYPRLAVVLQGEANELRKQLGVARSLRNGSSPEFDEKMTRLKQLREMRKAILDKVGHSSSDWLPAAFTLYFVGTIHAFERTVTYKIACYAPHVVRVVLVLLAAYSMACSVQPTPACWYRLVHCRLCCRLHTLLCLFMLQYTCT
jgi:hypothetical protein